MKRFRTSLRAAALAVSLVVPISLVWWLTADPVAQLGHGLRDPRRVIGQWTIDVLVVDVASALLLVATIGFVLMVGLAAAAALTSARAPAFAARCRTATPARCRRIIAVLLGLGVVSTLPLGAPAFASEHRAPCPASSCPAQLPSLGGLRLPDLPLTPLPRRPSADVAEQISVQPGDSLWRIAERRLGPTASNAHVADLTHRLYALNRATIGSNPDLIFPGMTLLAPEGKP
jgi:hypothetical protein